MSGRVRLLVSDIDGTLVRNDKSLSDDVVAAVRRVRKAGLMMSLISARPPSGIMWIAQRLQLTNVMGAFNGGTILCPNGAIVAAERLKPECAARALALLEHPAVTPWLFSDGLWYAQTIDGIYVPRERRAANVEPVITNNFAVLLARVDKIVGVSGDHAVLVRLDATISATLGRDATVGRSQRYYLEITAPAANKGDGLSALARAAGVALDEVAVIGDQRNDLPMFARAGLSIAMGQGPSDVRAAADRVTRSNEEDGVASAIDEIVLAEVTR